MSEFRRSWATSPYHVKTMVKEDGRVYLQETSDVSSIVEGVKRRHNEGFFKNAMGDYHVGSYPLAKVQEWARARGKEVSDVVADDELFRRMTLDPDLSALRVWKGTY